MHLIDLLTCLSFLGDENQGSLNQNDETFKPGWEDIFRMNQSELESEIRKVSRDPTLDPRRKAYLIQNLLTRFLLYGTLSATLSYKLKYILLITNEESCCCSRWIAAQQKSSQVSIDEQADGDVMPGCSPSFRDADCQIFGCEHYKRNCKLLAACCNKLFTCRYCHDEVSDHSMDRQVLC